MSQQICETCGNIGEPKTFTPGSFFLELLFYLLACLPGLIYSAWRLANRKKGCPVCQGTMLPLTTPRGRQLAAHYHPTLPIGP
jgi:hypothetical protein